MSNSCECANCRDFMSAEDRWLHNYSTEDGERMMETQSLLGRLYDHHPLDSKVMLHWEEEEEDYEAVTLEEAVTSLVWKDYVSSEDQPNSEGEWVWTNPDQEYKATIRLCSF
jgi:hypothetical protein